MNRVGAFPFGQAIYNLEQRDRTPKRIFVLGVYASAVHARWYGADNKLRISAVAVASEPEIFWRGENAAKIIESIPIPPEAGRLAAADSFNGPSGRALDESFLFPLKLSRGDTWLCDLVPHSCMNSAQAKALNERYRPFLQELGLPDVTWPDLPKRLIDDNRKDKIEAEVSESGADILITLGDQPLKWFSSHFGTKSLLSAYGKDPDEYGRLHPIPEKIGGRIMKLLPLVHPRQAARLGSHSSDWYELHKHWIDNVAPTLLSSTGVSMGVRTELGGI